MTVGSPDWLRRRIVAAGLDPDSVAHEEHQAQAASSVTMRNIFTSLRLMGDVDWGSWFEGVSLIEHELRGSPGYTALDFATRNLYRESHRGPCPGFGPARDRRGPGRRQHGAEVRETRSVSMWASG